MIKKITFAAVLALSILCSMFVLTNAGGSTISIYVNNYEIATDVKPYIENSRIFVPVRAICGALGIDDIVWNGKEKTVTIRKNSAVQFTVGQKYAFKDGKRFSLDAATEIRDGRTMVPVRFLAEAFGAKVEWDGIYSSVDINRQGITVPESCKASEYTKDDLVWLSKIVSAESRGEPFNGQIAVANVVLNRVNSKDYPNTVYGVIFDTKHGVQFQPAANGTVYNTPGKTSVEAAKRAIAGENHVGECMYFLNESIATNTWIVENRKYYTTIHNHSFYV